MRLIAVVAAAALTLFAGVAWVDEVPKQPTWAEYLGHLERLEKEQYQAMKDRSALKRQQIGEERKKIAASMKGAAVTGTLHYGGNKLVTVKKVKTAKLVYKIEWSKDGNHLAYGKLTPEAEAKFTKEVIDTAKLGVNYEFQGKISEIKAGTVHLTLTSYKTVVVPPPQPRTR